MVFGKNRRKENKIQSFVSRSQNSNYPKFYMVFPSIYFPHHFLATKRIREKRIEKLGFEDSIFYLKDGSLCRPCYSFFGFFFFFFFFSAANIIINKKSVWATRNLEKFQIWTSFYLRTTLLIHPHLSLFSLQSPLLLFLFFTFNFFFTFNKYIIYFKHFFFYFLTEILIFLNI